MMLQRDLQKKPEQEGLSITLFSAMGEYHYLSCHPHRGQQILAWVQGGSGDKETGGRRRRTGTREPTRSLTPGAASRRGRQAAGGVTHLSKRTGWSRLHNIS